MEEIVQIPVTVRGQERTFDARVQVWRYGLRFLVDVDGVEMIFERDDAGAFRAVLPEGAEGKVPDKDAIRAIVEVLDSNV